MTLAARAGVFVCSSAYAALLGFTALHHEPWADEAQSWLLARDASLFDLWRTLLHYEGTPGLWHTLLHGAIRLGVPYTGLNLISATLGLIAAWLVFRYAPLPLPYRIALPFSFFLCYQFGLIARSYALLPPLVFASAIAYQGGVQRVSLLAVLLSLMAAVSVHGMLLSITIAASFAIFVVRADSWRRILPAALAYACVLVALILATWPARDEKFLGGPNPSLAHLASASGDMLRDAFAGEWVPTIAILALSLPFLWRGRGLMMFLSSSVLLCLFGGIVYANVWHHGILFLAWLFAIWISAAGTKLTAPVLAALSVALIYQCYWTAATIRYDLREPYSGARDAAAFLHQTDIPAHGLFGLGYACVAIQPYFARNVFTNFDAAYWDWSSRNQSIQDAKRLDVLRPDYVIVGYTGETENYVWNDLVKKAGYIPMRHFGGNLYWRTEILEPDAFDLYRRRDLLPVEASR